MTDPLGCSTWFKFFGGVTLSGGGQWGSQYYGSMLIEATYHEGDKYQADYAGPFKAVTAGHIPKPGSVEPTLTKTYGYGSCASPGTYQNCGKPIWIQDPRGNRAHYAYWPHGGIWTEMAPAPAANGARPLKVTTWVQRYAWVKNSGGTLVQASLPVWVKNTETQCQTVAGTNGRRERSAPKTVTTYEYGADGPRPCFFGGRW